MDKFYLFEVTIYLEGGQAIQTRVETCDNNYYETVKTAIYVENEFDSISINGTPKVAARKKHIQAIACKRLSITEMF